MSLSLSDKSEIAPQIETVDDSESDEGKTGRRLKRAGVPLASLLVGLILWQLIASLLVANSLFLASPIQTLQGIVDMWTGGSLRIDLIYSGQEALYGFLVGSLLGILFGTLVAKFELLRRILSPYISGFYATPIIALAPIFILWFGLGIFSKVLVIISLVVFPQIISTEAGIKNVDDSLREVALAFGASPLTVFLKVDMWASLPYILARLRLGVGRALIGVIVGELFGATHGLGLAIFNSQSEFNMKALFGSTAIFAVTGITLTYALQFAEHRLTPWAPRKA